MFESWHWPQWVEAGMLALGTVIAICRHGEPKGNYDGVAAFIAAGFIAWLLWCGGFWG